MGGTGRGETSLRALAASRSHADALLRTHAACLVLPSSLLLRLGPNGGREATHHLRLPSTRGRPHRRQDLSAGYRGPSRLHGELQRPCEGSRTSGKRCNAGPVEQATHGGRDDRAQPECQRELHTVPGTYTGFLRQRQYQHVLFILQNRQCQVDELSRWTSSKEINGTMCLSESQKATSPDSIE